MLLTRRLERAGMKPLGFVANEYALAVWGSERSRRPHCARGTRTRTLFAEDMLGDDLEEWLAESALMKRTFRSCAIIAGLIERRFPGRKNPAASSRFRRISVSDVRKHQPDHILLRAARADAATGLLDIKRLAEMLSRIQGRIVRKALDHLFRRSRFRLCWRSAARRSMARRRYVAGGSRRRTGERGDELTNY